MPLMVPLIGHALRQTNLGTMALGSKGFHPTAHRSFFITGKIKGSDYAVLILLSLLLGVSGLMRWHGIGTLDIRF